MRAAAEGRDPHPPRGLSHTRTAIRSVDSGVAVAGGDKLQVAIEVRCPDPSRLPETPVALVCLPGGGMNRRFFDLMPDDGGTDFSFAEQLCARGFIVVLVDHPGVGDSSRPRDAFELTPEILVRADAKAIDEVLAALREGTLFEDVPALPDLKTVGVGHSMGAMLTVLLQVSTPMHAAVALLGFSTAGLPRYMSEEAQSLSAANPAAAKAELVRLARMQFDDSGAVRRSSSRARGEDLFAAGKVDPRGVSAVRAALAPLLPVPGMLSMMPGNIADACAALDVPVFIGVGELDMTGPPHRIPAAFTASRDVTLQVLAQSGHSHFLFSTRGQLFERLAAWASWAAAAAQRYKP